jgi:hypothetical protein
MTILSTKHRTMSSRYQNLKYSHSILSRSRTKRHLPGNKDAREEARQNVHGLNMCRLGLSLQCKKILIFKDQFGTLLAHAVKSKYFLLYSYENAFEIKISKRS